MHLLFPGRHLVNTRFQEKYLEQVLGVPLGNLKFLHKGQALPKEGSLDDIVFAITSRNMDNSRFNPVSYDKRIIAVDRFGSQFNPMGVKHRIYGIPDHGVVGKFAELTLKEILGQSEDELNLTPENTVVMCSTPSVIELYRKLGFSILPAELVSLNPNKFSALMPIEVVRLIAEAGENWAANPAIRKSLSFATLSAFLAHPEVPKKIIRLFTDPLLTEEGSLTETRDYGTYVVGMGNRQIIEFKYGDIRHAIKPGKVVDHGCADGALIARMAEDSPDSDFYGIDASATMIELAKQGQTLKRFGNDTFVFFRHGNIISPLFKGPTADTITSLSLLHEVWSYGAQQRSIDDYLASVSSQLVPGGRLVVRDVVGPENKEQEVYLWCNPDDGSNEDVYATFEKPQDLKSHLDSLSTKARFQRFAEDFLADMRNSGRRGPEKKIGYRTERVGGLEYFVLKMKDAAEFMTTKDYTDNWKSEMNEEFTFKSFAEWKRTLARAGYRVIEDPNEPEKGSRAYTNPWMVEKVFKDKVALYARAQDGTLKPMAWPVTNMVLVGERR